MTFEIPKTSYSGKIRAVTLGKGDKAVTIGGETSYPFYLFEGEMPHVPRIAMEIWDCPPEEWPEAAIEPFAGVTDDPVAWAKKCINEYGAEMIALQLISTDPNGLNRESDEAAEVIKKVADAIDVPLIVWGCNNEEKDTEVLRKVCEVCEDKNLIVGPVQEGNHKKIGAPAIGYHHTVISSTPIDINLAKQLNILLGNLGVPDEQIVMDPTVSSIGYGIEYADRRSGQEYAALPGLNLPVVGLAVSKRAGEVKGSRTLILTDQSAGQVGVGREYEGVGISIGNSGPGEAHVADRYTESTLVR